MTKMRFDEVPVGQTFLFAGDVFFKLNDSPFFVQTWGETSRRIVANAVNLSTYAAAGFWPEEIISVFEEDT